MFWTRTIIALSFSILGPGLARAQTTTTTTTTTPAPAPAPTVVVVTPSPAPVPVAPPVIVNQGDPLAHTHHGLWSRVQIGPAGFAMSTNVAGDKWELSGGGGGFSLAAGFAISRSLVIYGEVFDDIGLGPTLTMNGQDVGMLGSNVSAGIVGFGPGLQYYTASNFFIGGTATLFRLIVQQDGNDVARSDTGYGVSLRVGQEWWVSDNWGFGVAAHVFVGSVPVSDQDTAWTAAGVTLALSASFH